MIRLATLAAVVVALAAAATASAHTVLVDTAGQPLGGKWQQWVDRSRVPTPDVVLTVSFTNPDQATSRAYFIPDESKTTLYVPGGRLDRHEVLHEIGHLYDYTILNDLDRHEIMRRVLGGLTPEWRQFGGDSAHEQFAEAYAFAAQYRWWRDDGHGQQMNYGIDEVMTPRRFELLVTWLTNIPIVRRLEAARAAA